MSRLRSLALLVAAAACGPLPPPTVRPRELPPLPPSPQAVAAARAVAEQYAAVPEWLAGVWMREWIRRGDRQTSGSLVRWLQTPREFGDLRVPLDRPAFARATSFDDLTDDDLRALARQQGFVGRTTVQGLTSTWRHELDFQPADSAPDVGRLERYGPRAVYEHALDGAYVEHWRALSDGDGRFVVVRVTRGGRLDRLLLVVGDYFYYARNRAADLPAAPSLTALIARERPTRAQLVAWLDCELSVGRVRGGRGAWEIEHSTLPWREGRRLEFVDRIAAEPTTGALTSSGAPGETWEITRLGLPPEDGVVLFPGAGR